METYREYLASQDKLEGVDDATLEKEAKKIFSTKAGLYFQLADRMLDYLEANPRQGTLSEKIYRKKLADATKPLDTRSGVKQLEGVIGQDRLAREKTKKPLPFKKLKIY